MKVIKKQKPTEEYNSKKLYRGIVKAMKSGSGVYYPKIAQIICEEADEKFGKKEEIKTKDLDKFVLNRLNEYGQNLTANAYERYKTAKYFQRQEDIVDKDISGIINGSNTFVLDENSNKNGEIISTQRDLIAGVLSRSFSERKILPTSLLNAHNEGLIHIHDTDYLIHPGCFNCFSRDTSFITSQGLKSFNDFNDGDTVYVPTHKGNWKKAVVHNYGKQILYEYRISTIDREGYGVKVKATKNHRWFNNNGEEQIGLNVGDKLLTCNHLINQFDFDNMSEDLQRMWCYGFALAEGNTYDTLYMYSHGLVEHLKSDTAKHWRTQLRLCGNNVKYADRFAKLGYSVYTDHNSSDLNVELRDFNKKDFLNNKEYLNLSKEEGIALFNGLLNADGNIAYNSNSYSSISSSDERIIEIIKLFADLSGWFITNVEIDNEPTNSSVRNYPLHTFGFNTYLPSIYTKSNGVEVIEPKTLKVIEENEVGEDEVWCLEVEDDHSFILEGGIPTGNCCLINLKDIFANGTVINGKMIETPKSLRTAATVASQISLAVASGQHGGQTMSISHLSPYVRISYEKWLQKYQTELGDKLSQEEIIKQAEIRTREEVKESVQIIQFQENTFNSSNGQTPFVSIFMYLNEEPEYIKETALLIEEMLKLRLLGMKNEYGVYVTPAFPKLLYVLDDNNIPQDSEYRYLTDLAVKTTAKRMNPDYISAKIMRENFDGNVFPCMGCRSFLSPWKDENGNYKFYGRFNRGVVTLNLVDVALSSQGDEEKFWKILEERLELCKEALIVKDKMLMCASSDVSPIHWQYGALSRLGKGESILPLLRNGYSSISLGYIGIYEMTKIMKDCSHTEERGKEFALQVMKYLEDKTIAWREIENLHGCSLYGTPSESLCYKFSRTLKKRFGEICGITDKLWQTNSYHVCVTEPIDAFSKLSLESEFQKLSKGGAVSYIEVPNMEDNIEALSEVVDFMYNTIQYAEINTRNGDSCGECGFEGEMQINEEGEWYCPQCGCKDRDKLTVVRRTCGYIGSTFWNKGKTEEINERVMHL